MQETSSKMMFLKPLVLETEWIVLEEAIVRLHKFLEGETVKSPLFTVGEKMKLYTTVYNLCFQKPAHDYSSQLYDRYKNTFVEYIHSAVLPSLREKHGVIFLKELVRRWSDHKTKVRWLSCFFTYLDRFYVIRNCLPPLKEVGLTCFRDEVYQDVKGRARDVVLILIDQERDGEQIDRTLIKNVADVFTELSEISQDKNLDLYEIDFEEPILCSTTNYYAKKASKHIDVDSCPQYMLMAEKCLTREREMAFSFLHEDSVQKLLQKVQHQFLLLQSNQLLEKENTGLHALLRDNEVKHLSRMYRLFSDISGGLEPVAEIFEKHVTEEGLTLVKSAEDAATEKKDGKDTIGVQDQVFVSSLIEHHDRFMGYVNDHFKGHSLFQKAVKEGFTVICNKDVAGISSPELLSIFVDNVLKKGGGTKKLYDDVIEETLEKTLDLLIYVDEKDIFAEFCRKKLSRRLLFDRSVDLEHERSLLSKLKRQWGGQYTSKMEGMVMDVTLARENLKGFEDYLQNNLHENAGIDIAVTVLTTVFWPSYKSSDLQLPSEMASGVGIFKNYYETKTKHKKLNFIYSLGTCIITGRFKPKPIELVVSTYQAVTLMLFNDSEKLSYREIVSQLNLADDDVIRLLHSLSCSRYKILNKEPNSRTISKNDTFAFNSMFTDKMRRIKVPLPLMDDKKIMEDVDKDRRYMIDAAVVRIMKSRKAMNFQQLSSECVEQLNHMFKPDFKLIKKRIEDLILRDYLERDKNNPTTITYVA